MTDDVKRFGPGRMSPGTSGVGAFVVKNMSPVSSSNDVVYSPAIQFVHVTKLSREFN